jgi:phytoene dehydrogenase-like protein
MNALKSGQGKTVAACVGASPALETFWQPLTVSVLNAEPDEAAATLLWRVLAQTVLKGGALAKPLFTRQGLGAALIDPALVTLARLGADVRFGSRVQAMDIDGQRIRSLDLGTQAEILGTGDLVVLAVPHFVAQDLLPGLSAPTQSRAILNVHFKLPLSREAPSMIGLVHARAQWIFVRGDVASVTISAAEKWMDQDADAIASAVWPEVVAVLGEAQALSVTDLPPHRVIKERRATFAQTPSALTMRPQTNTSIDNLFLAGDWTATDLPATIEGALKSGRRAAEFALKS